MPEARCNGCGASIRTSNDQQFSLWKEQHADHEGGSAPQETEAPETEAGFEPQHVGGGYYELSNGERVQGKEAAFEAQKAL